MSWILHVGVAAGMTSAAGPVDVEESHLAITTREEVGEQSVLWKSSQSNVSDAKCESGHERVVVVEEGGSERSGVALPLPFASHQVLAPASCTLGVLPKQTTTDSE